MLRVCKVHDPPPRQKDAVYVLKLDPVRGEIIKVFVVLQEGHEPSEKLITDIQQHVKRITAPYKYPREIEFVTELPKTISGKIKRKELRTMEFERKRDLIEKLKEKGLWLRSD